MSCGIFTGAIVKEVQDMHVIFIYAQTIALKFNIISTRNLPQQPPTRTPPHSDHPPPTRDHSFLHPHLLTRLTIDPSTAMARLRHSSKNPNSRAQSHAQSDADSLYRNPSTPPPERNPDRPPRYSFIDVSPGTASASDKENNRISAKQQAAAKQKAGNQQQPQQQFPRPNLPTDGTMGPTTGNTRQSKRRRLNDGSPSGDDTEQDEEEGAAEQSTSSLSPSPTPTTDGPTTYNDGDTTLTNNHAASEAPSAAVSGPKYDPHQSLADRRQVRKSLRDLEKKAQDSRSEWMDPSSNGLEAAVRKSTGIFKKVKQTADATMDSRFLVEAGDMAYRKSMMINSGADGATGIDIDEFVGKCISFMNEGGAQPATTTTQSGTRRNRRTGATQLGNDSDDDEAGLSSGDALNWSHLGRYACLPYNFRPALPSFLLGPLSVQKRQRKQISRRSAAERRAEQQSQNAKEAVQAGELDPAELARSKNKDSDLTSLCKKIHKRLGEVIMEGREACAELWHEEISEEEEVEIRDRYHLCDDVGVNLFRFAINPQSFGQSVENLFYISFLVRDGAAEVRIDDSGIPSLHIHDKTTTTNTETDKSNSKSSSSTNAERRQSVFSLDFETWSDIIEVFGCEGTGLIGLRDEDGLGAVGEGGWYG
ncbi:MAG: nuclear protein [Alyxoria varia]|nr:MAG: nuclear protein [Alyxoria varia]